MISSPPPLLSWFDLARLEVPRVFCAAAKALELPPVSLTAYRAALSTGGPNDFYSNGDYWWPDPAAPGGLPYVRRDGQTNPANFNHHRLAIRRLRDAVAALGAAFAISRKNTYALKAAELLHVFFIDPATRMNPHLRYAQAIPGVSEGRGIGIIDTLHLIEIPVAIEAMSASPIFDANLVAGLRSWFAAYLDWMITSPNGRDEGAEKNNHAVAYWLQVAVFARFTGDERILAECRRQFKETFLPEQMAADGSFPAELRRTKPYAYSIFQLDNLVTLAQVLSRPGDELWDFESPSGRGVRRAVAFLSPFLADKTSWPLPPDVQAWDGWPTRSPALLFAGLAFGMASYVELWHRLPSDPVDEEVQRNLAITQPLLWLPFPSPEKGM
ncbi:alginate lyase [Verrucomicrobia bacterium IMCC26134]|nr:alginate lyase [Verrucomicrobia bacterium IMCC26134]